jgi:Zn-dependent protease with chaperone function
MNFFQHQHKARRKTGILVLYFILAVVLIIVAINAFIFLVITWGGSMSAEEATRIYKPLVIYITLGTVVIISIGSLITLIKLRGGGQAVAKMVGARQINPDTDDINEQRLINVVEEMSIASGTPVPKVYVMDNEPGINAFVAGLRPTETVLVVTKGALEIFNRDELQGVVGHEYSHIFNGDMRINIRLMAVLAGILMIAQGGRVLMRSSSRSRGKGSGQAGLIGLGLFIIGYVGLFFGGLIKASISRQREFLADASSVQFTRNPEGIAAALWKIRQHVSGSLLDNSHSDDLSHFCFGETVRFRLSSLMATHPPLDVRIMKIDPGYIKRLKTEQLTKTQFTEKNIPGPSPVTAVTAGFAPAAVVASSATAKGIGDSIGRVDASHLDYAERLHAAIPKKLLQAVHRIRSVQDVIFAMVLAGMEENDRQTGVGVLQGRISKFNPDTLNGLIGLILQSGQQVRLPLLNMALPLLKSLSKPEQENFLSTLESLIKSDQRYTVFEFSLFTILSGHLAANSGRDAKEKYFKYSEVIDQINLLISILARVGAKNEKDAAIVHARIIILFSQDTHSLVPRSDCSLTSISSALQELNLLSLMLKKTVIEACADCVIHDGKILPAESELVQAIAVSLDCPMPPILAIQ